MKFVCDKCKTKYSIADDKVRRKVLKIRCKNCSNIIVVRETRAQEESGAHAAPRSAGSGVRPLARAFDGAFRGRRRSSSALKPVPSSRPLLQDLPSVDDEFEPEETRLSAVPDFMDEAPPPEDEWYLAVDAHQYGPMGFGELCSRVKRGEAGGESFVWRDGFDEWLEPADVPELRPYLPKHPPPPPRGKSGLYSVVPPAGTPHAGVPMVGVGGVPQQPLPGYITPPGGPAVPPPQPAPVPAPAPAAPAAAAGGSQVAPLPGLGGLDGPVPGTGSQVQPMPQAPAAPEPDLTPLPVAPQASKEMPPFAPAIPVQPTGRTPLWMVIAGVGGGLAAICGLILVGYFLLFDRTEPEKQQPAANPLAAQQPAADPSQEVLIPDAGGEPIAFPPMEIAQSEKAEHKVRSTRAPRRASRDTPEPRPKKMTAEQQRLMALYNDKENPSGSTPANAPAPRRTHSGPKRRISPGELMALQRKNKAALKACYERALKRDNTLTEIKAEVQVSIGDSGVVRSVHVGAGNNPDLVTCIKRSIKRWPFPAIGSQTFSFPIIFRGT